MRLGLGLGLAKRASRAGAPPAPVAPVNTSLPVISGAAMVGETLATTDGAWTGSPSSYAYQWYADAVAISGATNNTYTLTATEEGASITVGVVATNAAGASDEAVSGAVGPVEAAAGDTVAPVLSLPVGFETGPTAATVGATTDEGNGTLYYVVTTSATAPSAAQIKAGSDHTGAAAAADDMQTVATTGAKTFSVTGLSAETGYYAHLMQEDAATNQSNVVSSAQFTTQVAPDVTAPILSSPTDVETGTTTATIGVTTDEANGTLYRYLSTSATPPSAADLKAGTGAVQSGSATITTTGAKSYNLTGLTAETTYYAHFLHRDAAGNDSTIASGDGFTTIALGAGELDPAITPPVLSLAVGATTYPPEFDVALDDTVVVGDTLRLQWGDIDFSTITGDATNVIDSGEATANAATFTGLSSISSPDVYYFRCRVEQADGDYSAWSDTVLHGEAVDSTPAAFSFTDINDATLSTVYESNAVTLSGFNQPVAISVTGGEYAVDTGSGYGAYTSSAGTAYPGDLVKVRHTSSGSNSTATNTVLTVGGVSDTYTTTTLAASVSLPSSGLILQLDADDLSTLYQTVDGTTTAVSADNDPVGYWADKSGNAFHLSAAGNDTTRPTYRAGGGLPYIEFDGTNDILRRLAGLGLYSGGACTVAIALRTTNATHATANLGIFMEGNSASNNPVYEAGTVGGASDDISRFIRNDANTQINLVSNNTTLATGLGGSDSVLTFTDSGSTIIDYHDGASTITRTYTRSGTLTLNRFAIMGWQRGSAASWLGGRVYAVAAWNRVLDSTERADVLTYMASKQGRLL